MKSGIQHFPFTMSQGQFPRMIVSPVKVYDPSAPSDGITLRLDSTAQWDTGADYCLISRELVDALRLTPVGDADVNTAEGDYLSRKLYKVNLVLPNGIYFEDVPAIIDNGLKKTGIDFLIGMYVINDLDFALTHNPAGETVLSISFPGDKLVDFSSRS